MTAAAGTLLERADAARADSDAASPSELWKIAVAEANGSPSGRRERFHHAMIHAGYLVAARSGKPYSRCPVCKRALP